MKFTQRRKIVGGFGLGIGQVEISLFLKMLTISVGSELPTTDVSEADKVHSGGFRAGFDFILN